MDFLKIKNNAESVDIYVVGDIVDDSFKGWFFEDDEATFPSSIRKMLDDAKGKAVNVYINSGGGHVFAGVAISNMLARHDGPTKAIIDGLAASSASIIAFGCDEIEMPENAFLMIHRPTAGAWGNSDDLLKTAEVLDTIQSGIEVTYLKHAVQGVTKEQIHDMVNTETWLTGEEATAFFNVRTTQPLQAVACAGDLAFSYDKAPKALTREVEPSKTEQMKKEIEIALAAY